MRWMRRHRTGGEGAALRNQGSDPAEGNPARHAGADHGRARKRALIAASEGKRQEQINLASGAREAAIQKSEGERQAAINKAQGEAAAILAVAEANAQAIQKIGQAIRTEGGVDAVNLKVAEEYVSAFGNLAKQGNTLIVPGNMGDLSTMIASALTIVKQQRPSA